MVSQKLLRWSILLTSCAFTIELKPSNDYARLGGLLHVVAVVILVQSDWPWWLKCLLGLLLLISLRTILLKKMPMPAIVSLSYRQTSWYLSCSNGNTLSYDTLTFRLDSGFVLLLELSDCSDTQKPHSKTKNLVIFRDQLSPDAYRMLRLRKRLC